MICLLISCISTYTTRTIPSLTDDILPVQNETEIIIRNEVVLLDDRGRVIPDMETVLLFVYIDDKLIAQVNHNSSERIIVPNGNHRIRVQYGLYFQDHPINISFTANSERLTFIAYYATEEIINGVAAFVKITTFGLADVNRDMKKQKSFLLLEQSK